MMQQGNAQRTLENWRIAIA